MGFHVAIGMTSTFRYRLLYREVSSAWALQGFRAFRGVRSARVSPVGRTSSGRAGCLQLSQLLNLEGNYFGM